MSLLSIILPARNEAGMLEKTVNAVESALKDEEIGFEILIIDDGSTDGTWEKAEKLCAENAFVRALSLSRNFGKESAIFAGLEHAFGDCCVVMDCDLQHPPGVICEMLRLWRAGYLIVEGRKKKRQRENRVKGVFARAYYGILRITSGLDLKNASDFKLLDRQVMDELLKMPERQMFFRAISGWMGFCKAEALFDVPEREGGKSKWSPFSLFKLALNSITSFTSAPMHIVTFFGAVFLIFAVGLSVQSLYMKISGKADAGFTTVIILLLIIGSIIMMSLGIIGVYLSKIYEEIKQRPRYIVRKKIGGDK